MKRPTPAIRAAVLTVPFFTSLIAPAQQTDTELLRVIACELRELRSVIRQGLVVVPLVEANVRERVQIQARISELEDERRGIDQKVQESTDRLVKVRERLRKLSQRSRNDSSEEVEKRKRGYATELEHWTQQLQIHQSHQTQLTTEISRAQSRLAQFDDEFDQMQRQI